MSLNLDWNFPPMTFVTKIVEDIDLPEYNHVSKYGNDKDIEAILIDHIFYKKDKYGKYIKDIHGRKIPDSYGYIIYKHPFKSTINYNSSDEVPGILVYVKMNKDINREEVKRVLKSSKVKEAAYQYFINKKELQNHIDDKSMYGHVDGIPDWKDIHAAQDEANENRKRNQINLLPNNPDPDIPNKYINPNEKMET